MGKSHNSMNQTERLHSLQDIFEMALTLSRDNGSAEVLCIDFLPWADIVVWSSFGEFPRDADGPDEVRARWAAVSRYLGFCVSSPRPQRLGMANWHLGGGFNYWPTSLREQAHRDQGPFRLVIECHNPLERILGPSR